MEDARLELAIGGHALVNHPDSPPANVPKVSFTYVWKSASDWAFDFFVPVPPTALRLPGPAEPARRDELWERTCFELFLMSADNDSYLEFNFAPSGEWAAYHFHAYRSGRRPLEVEPPRIITSDPDQFKIAMDAQLRALGLDDESIRLLGEASPPIPESAQFWLRATFEDPALDRGQSWRAGISAVIEESDGTRSYWALKHPPGAPDFHHPDCFALELPAAKTA